MEFSDPGAHDSPRHPGDLPEGTVHAILRQAGLSADDYMKL
jgi:predicted RNA binding protein YcfA (HicA-like mRNA interferase family)